MSCKWSCDRHVKQSHGPDTDLMKFYCTSYSTTYGQHWNKFEPRKGRHTGTGYSSNFRPQVYYTPELDDLDNPTMKILLSDNYDSVTKKHYRGYGRPTGHEPLSTVINQNETGYIRDKSLTIPTKNQVKSLYVDERSSSAPIDLLPRHTAVLHQTYAKDPTEAENYGYGPKFMSTEAHTKFSGHQPDAYSYMGQNPGRKEESGFTHAVNDEPVTYYPSQPHDGMVPDFMTNRPTGVSIGRTSFLPIEYGAQKNRLPGLVPRAVRDTGFTTGTQALPAFVHRNPSDAFDKAENMPPARLNNLKKNDPTEFFNVTHPNGNTSMTTLTYPPKPVRPDYGDANTGCKEDSGFTTNQDRFIQKADNPARFVTHYSSRFLDRTPPALEQGGHLWGGVLPQKTDAFTKSTVVHGYGKVENNTQTLQRLEPYVARSIRARDQFLLDTTHDAKQRSLKSISTAS